MILAHPPKHLTIHGVCHDAEEHDKDSESEPYQRCYGQILSLLPAIPSHARMIFPYNIEHQVKLPTQTSWESDT